MAMSPRNDPLSFLMPLRRLDGRRRSSAGNDSTSVVRRLFLYCPLSRAISVSSMKQTATDSLSSPISRMTWARNICRVRIFTRTDFWRFSIATDAPFDGRRGEKLRSSLFILQGSFDKDHSSSEGAFSEETLAAG